MSTLIRKCVSCKTLFSTPEPCGECPSCSFNGSAPASETEVEAFLQERSANLQSADVLQTV